MARKGGLATKKKYGREHFIKMGIKGRSVQPKHVNLENETNTSTG